MTDTTLSLSKEARRRRPYSSLYAALLFQSFRDALAEASPEESPGDRDEAAPRTRQALSTGYSPLVSQA
jgi:hypothetical protein